MKPGALPIIECGIDRIRFYEDVLPKSSVYGLLSNASSINQHGLPVQEVLIECGYKIVKIFSPEHGYHAQGIDGQSQPDDRLEQTTIPIISLYGNQLKPTLDQLRDLDAMIIDLPNIGTRFYTYLWTMVLMLEACEEARLPVIILDRPNPLGGTIENAEGPIMNSQYFSFIGNWSIPVRFGLTLGELALLIKKEKHLNHGDLQVIKTSGWMRSMNIFQYQYPFIPPSPAIQEPITIFTYPAICYLEATNISEGRGTAFPFQIAVAPWIHAKRLQNFLEDQNLPGVSFQAISIIPVESKYQNQPCHGIKLVITNFDVYKAVATGLMILASIQFLFPDHFQWSEYPTVANPDGSNHFQKLTGDKSLKTWLDQNPLNDREHLDQLLKVGDWQNRCKSILLYE